MPVVNIRFADALQKLINRNGIQLRISYFTQSLGSVWDDDVTLSKSGNDLWTSGIVFPISQSKQSADSVLLEQGKLLTGDIRLFTHGSLLFTGSEQQVRIQVGSTVSGTTQPILAQFSLLPEGTVVYTSYGQPIYKKVYLRQIMGSSLFGE